MNAQILNSESCNPYFNHCAERLENESDSWDEQEWEWFFTESLKLLFDTAEALPC